MKLALEGARVQLRYYSNTVEHKKENNHTKRIAGDISLVKTPGEEKETRKVGTMCTSQRTDAITFLNILLCRGLQKPLTQRSSTAPIQLWTPTVCTAEDTKCLQVWTPAACSTEDTGCFHTKVTKSHHHRNLPENSTPTCPQQRSSYRFIPGSGKPCPSTLHMPQVPELQMLHGCPFSIT